MTDCWAKAITFPGCTTMLYKYDLMYDVHIWKQICDAEFATQTHNGVADDTYTVCAIQHRSISLHYSNGVIYNLRPSP